MTTALRRRRWAVLAAGLATGSLAGCGSSASLSTDGGRDVADEPAAEAPVEEVARGDTSLGFPLCFIESGDGHDAFQDGTPAVVVTSSPWREPCGQAWVSTNADGFTKPEVPATETLRRDFNYFDVPVDRVTFTLSYAVDDAAEFILNGRSVASCSPTGANAGECQHSCRVVTIPNDALAPQGNVNTLLIKMTNLANADAGGGHTGWTGITYSVCMTFN